MVCIGDLPPSPLSGELAGTTFLGLPPLTISLFL
ncbi:MAG: hypothetical protein Ct9H300mP15_22690 [Gemmatimonadota bacterium]|nr:MAG: hypothetical protein Ct9H300mP15_22690 [Gemmatimonadota bacterium]